MLLAQLLLDWYDCNKRDLPWRENSDPYRVWVSEVMLQQTRVEAVRTYYEHWMERYPTLTSLADASEDEVLYLWQGLGYYSRAKNLLQGVREVMARYGGKIPEDRDAIRTISGIGDYTAGAIASIAYGKKEAAVDGNVLRVFARLYCVDDDIARSSAKRKITALVEREIDSARPGEFNQAVMDLGSAVCIPKKPRCSHCPLISVCMAYYYGCQNELPSKVKRSAARPIDVAAGILMNEGRFLLRRRPDKGLLGGLWEFPAVELKEGADAAAALEALFQQELGQSIRVGEVLFQITHLFSHRKWDISFYRCFTDQSGILPQGTKTDWFQSSAWEKLSLAGPHKKAAERLKSLPLYSLNKLISKA